MVPIAAIDSTVVTAIVGGLLSGGLVGALAIWRKAGPEADQIVAKTLIEVNEHLRKELADRDQVWADEVKRRDEEIERLREEVARLRDRLSEVQEDLSRVERELSNVVHGSSAPPPVPPSPK